MIRPSEHKRSPVRHVTFVVLGAALLASPAFAQTDPDRGLGFRGWGPRVGLTAGPDQVHFGAHLDLGSIGGHVGLTPSLELGLGDDQKVSALNFDLTYRFSSYWYSWSPYLGAGPSLFIVDTDPEIGEGDTNTDAGLNLIGGIERGFSRGKFFVDGKLGLADAPDFKVTAGWTFLIGGAASEGAPAAP